MKFKGEKNSLRKKTSDGRKMNKNKNIKSQMGIKETLIPASTDTSKFNNCVCVRVHVHFGKGLMKANTEHYCGSYKQPNH